MKAQEPNQFYRQSGVAMTCRSYEEYVRMFALEETPLTGLNVLDVAGGASSFAAVAAQAGSVVTAVDPLYRMSLEQIAEHGRLEIEVSTAKLAGVAHRYRWDYYGSLENHRANRERSLERFLADYATAKRLGGVGNALQTAPPRPAAYIPAMLPSLPLTADTFDLTLCSHFLFLYEEQFDYNFHVAAVLELLRVTKPGGEVRLYPLVNFRTERYSRLDQMRRDVEASGAVSRIETSRLPFLPNSDDILICRKTAASAGV